MKIHMKALCIVSGTQKKFKHFISKCEKVLGEGNGTPLQYSHLENPMDGGAWWAAVHGVEKSRTWLSDFTFTFHFHALEKEMATHSVLAWRISGMGEPGGRPSMGSHRVRHNWSDLAVAVKKYKVFCFKLDQSRCLLRWYFLLLLLNLSVMSNSLWPHELQHPRLPCPSLSPGAFSNSYPLSWWCLPTISFSSCPQSFPASESISMSWLFSSGGQSIGASTLASVLSMNNESHEYVKGRYLWC